tara:strand:+ start:58 stop:222 length:165 start_codon:yes stop_codon:yes gene_type:complete
MDCILCCNDDVKATKQIVFKNRFAPDESIELCDIHYCDSVKDLSKGADVEVLDI